MELTWQLAVQSAPEQRVRQDSVTTLEGGVEGIAEALDRHAGGHGLTVRVGDSRQHVVLSRT